MIIELATTSRGFAVGRFLDRYQRSCSIQESSLAEEACIWLGCDEGEGSRAHLTQEMAAALVPLLQHFVETGSLPLRQPTAEATICAP
ncbi:hypothetical protein [Methylobacterium sp. CCH5-D2]|uniref:hypothetical protein n=1 Tax=Methylobacterium sp. CCH5-D2 TaxID=1768765 RepID=UPI00082DEC29|nr:hypothetical protein [Methylobacterium sp. CCH5-D2]